MDRRLGIAAWESCTDLYDLSIVVETVVVLWVHHGPLVLLDAVGSFLRFGSFLREGRSVIEQFDDNEGYSSTRQRYRR